MIDKDQQYLQKSFMISSIDGILASRVTNLPLASNLQDTFNAFDCLLKPINRITLYSNSSKYSSSAKEMPSITSSSSFVLRISRWCKGDIFKREWSYSNLLAMIIYKLKNPEGFAPGSKSTLVRLKSYSLLSLPISIPIWCNYFYFHTIYNARQKPAIKKGEDSGKAWYDEVVMLRSAPTQKVFKERVLTLLEQGHKENPFVGTKHNDEDYNPVDLLNSMGEDRTAFEVFRDLFRMYLIQESTPKKPSETSDQANNDDSNLEN